ncbi:MAG: DUF1697 domain-containing protein [Solirubrobacterales bacterium]
MSRYVAFLRGMNLGNRRIKNDELRSLFEGLGFDGVATFRASGNVVFSAGGRGGEEALAKRIEAGLEEGLGYEVPVFLRSGAEVGAIAARQPFNPKLVESSSGKLQVALLIKKPSASARKTALALSSEADRLAIDGRELYWLPAGGISESELDLKALDVTLGTTTVRTMGTIEQIAAKHLA